MHDLHDIARRFVVGHMYLLYLGRLAPRMGRSTLVRGEVSRIQTALDVMRSSGLVAEAELITIEASLDGFDDQPTDVRSVLLRLVNEAEQLATNPDLLRQVAEHRRERFPGVIEVGKRAPEG